MIPRSSLAQSTRTKDEMNIPRESVARLFPRPHQPRTTFVGIEHELLTFDVRTGGVPSLEAIREAVEGSALTSAVSFEPGGQVELNTPCATSTFSLLRQVRDDLMKLQVSCGARGIRVHPFPVDLRGEHQVPLQLRTQRYVAMQEHFDRRGPAGRTMMRRTASTQVCLDWWAGAAGRDQWHLTLLAGPFVAAHFARTYGPGSRLATWLAVDPSRTAFDDRLLHGEDPIESYRVFAQHASSFVDGRDPDVHLTTLFPPVRPRGRYLEVRFADAQEFSGIERLLDVLIGLMYDDHVRDRALRWLWPERDLLAEHWQRAAAGHPDTFAMGEELSSLAIGTRRPMASAQ